MYDGPGIYRHYKGGIYEVIGIALIEATLDPVVVYRPLDKGPRQPFMEGLGASMWTRPLEDFNAMVRPEGEEASMFETPPTSAPLSPDDGIVPRFKMMTMHEIMFSRNERLLEWARAQLQD